MTLVTQQFVQFIKGQDQTVLVSNVVSRVRETPTRCTKMCSHLLILAATFGWAKGPASHVQLGQRPSQPHKYLEAIFGWAKWQASHILLGQRPSQLHPILALPQSQAFIKNSF